MVLSSAGTMQVLAPASTAMLQTAMRSSMSSASMPGPTNSRQAPIAPSVPISAEDRQDEVLSGDVRPAPPGEGVAHRFGDAEPQFAQRQRGRDVARPHARAERGERAGRARVRVAADHQVAWFDETALGQQRVFDPAVADVVVMRDAVLLRELGERGEAACRRDVLGRREVVADQHDGLRAGDARRAHHLELRKRQRAGDVVEQHAIDRADRDLARVHLVAGFGRKDLLGGGQRRSHQRVSSFIATSGSTHDTKAFSADVSGSE